MGRRWVVVCAFAAGALGLAIACGGKATAGASACADFQAALEPCVGGNFDGFQSYCEALLTLPGTEPNATSDLETCARSLNCTTLASTGAGPAACDAFSVGTLGAGASCVSSTQCQSSGCTYTSQTSPSGISGSWGCGTCDAPIAVGQPCGSMTQTNADCVPPAECIFGSGTSGTCEVPDAGGADAALPPGETIVGMGASCTPNNSGGPTIDGGIPTLMLCQTPLTCGPQSTCVPVTYAAAGQPCNDNATQCAVGGCNMTGPIPTDGGSGTGTCPTVIPNGQACDPTSSTAVCQNFSSCIDGTCQTINVAACASGG
jgi:hypothetical protein